MWKAEEGGDREKGGAGLPAGLPFSSDKGDGISWGVQVAACMAQKGSSLQRVPWSTRPSLWRARPLDETIEALVLCNLNLLRRLSPRLPGF